jgi:hypothetical protein
MPSVQFPPSPKIHKFHQLKHARLALPAIVAVTPVIAAMVVTPVSSPVAIPAIPILAVMITVAIAAIITRNHDPVFLMAPCARHPNPAILVYRPTTSNPSILRSRTSRLDHISRTISVRRRRTGRSGDHDLSRRNTNRSCRHWESQRDAETDTRICRQTGRTNHRGPKENFHSSFHKFIIFNVLMFTTYFSFNFFSSPGPRSLSRIALHPPLRVLRDDLAKKTNSGLDADYKLVTKQIIRNTLPQRHREHRGRQPPAGLWTKTRNLKLFWGQDLQDANR